MEIPFSFKPSHEDINSSKWFNYGPFQPNMIWATNIIFPKPSFIRYRNATHQQMQDERAWENIRGPVSSLRTHHEHGARSIHASLPHDYPCTIKWVVKQVHSQGKIDNHTHIIAHRKEACSERLLSLSGFSPGFCLLTAGIGVANCGWFISEELLGF